MRFLIFSILIYFVAGQAALLKALDVFKKNQWSVNKVLKANQLQAKQRADGLQRMIMAQSKIIQDLQAKLEETETKLDAVKEMVHSQPSNDRDMGYDDLKTKVSTLEIKLQQFADAEHADFEATDKKPIAEINLPIVKLPVVESPVPKSLPKTRPTLKPTTKPATVKPTSRLPELLLPVTRKPDKKPHTLPLVESRNESKKAVKMPHLPRGLMFNDAAINPIVVDNPEEPEEIEEVVEVEEVKTTTKKPIAFKMPPLTTPPPLVVDEPQDKATVYSMSPAMQRLNSKLNSKAGIGGLLNKLKQREVITTQAPTTVSQLQFTDDEPCVLVPGGTEMQSSWYNGGNEQITAKILITIPIPNNPPRDASILVTFNADVTDIQVWEANATPYGNGKTYLFTPHNPVGISQVAGGEFSFDFIATVNADKAESQVFFCRGLEDTGAVATTEAPEPTNPPESDDEIILDYDIAVRKELPSQFLSLMKNRKPTQKPKKVSARCQGTFGHPVPNPDQTDATNFTSSPSEELEIFPYDLNELIHKSILFYEAQRAGELPKSNRIPWRGDSTMRDGCDIGVDLSKGWFDAGDYVKFTFPAAYTATMLSWSLIDSAPAYKAANEYKNALDQVKWGLNWLIKAHVSPNSLVVMVGDPHKDHGVWGRPEDIRMTRPSYVVDETNGGTEPAAEAAAALAAGSVVFKDEDPKFAAKCLEHAKQLLEFADKNRKEYHLSVPKVSDFYKSWSGYEDELCWATAWLYKASGDTPYLRLAMYYYEQFGCGDVAESFDWDKKQAGVQLLMAQMTGQEKYRSDVERYANHLLDRQKTNSDGILYVHKWGTLRLAQNFGAFLIGASRLEPRLPRADEYFIKGIEQLGYALGDKGRSFVQGYGTNPPERSHHRAASCPESPQNCSNMLHSNSPNNWILYGAMVGGPDIRGQYTDKRDDYVNNEVAIDYNAGYQYSLAAAKSTIMEEIQKYKSMQ